MLLQEFHDILRLESEIFISFLPRILDDQHKLEWERVLALETTRELFLNRPLLLDLHSICDGRAESMVSLNDQVTTPKVFFDLLSSICGLIQKEISIVRDSEVHLSYEEADVKVSLLSQFDKSQAPAFPRLYPLLLSFDTISVFINGQLDDKECQSFRPLLQLSFLPILKALASMLTVIIRPDWRDIIFSTLLNLGSLVSNLDLKKEFTQVIEQLFDLPPSFNLLSWKTILYLVSSSPDRVGAAWSIVVRVIHSIDIYVAMRAKKTPQESSWKRALLIEDHRAISQVELDFLDQIADAVNDLIEKSTNFNIDTFTSMMEALCELAAVTRADLFVAQRMKQVSLKCIEKFFIAEPCDAWNILKINLIAMLRNQEGQIRSYAMETLAQISQTFCSTVDSDRFSRELILQERILQILVEALDIPESEKISVDIIGKVIQTMGPYLLPGGWQVCLEFISRAQKKSLKGNSVLLRSSFYLVKLITSDFLPRLDHACLICMIKTIGEYCVQPDDLNISLTSVGLIWDLSDFLRLNGSSENLDAFVVWITAIHLLLKLSIDSRPELRNSSVQTLIKTLEIFSITLSPHQWDTILNEVVQPLYRSVQEAAEAAEPEPVNSSTGSLIHHSRDTVEKQWDETLVLMIQGTVRLFSEFLKFIEPLSDFPKYWNYLLELLDRSCSSVKSTEVVGVAIPCFKHCIKSLQMESVVWRGTWETWIKISKHLQTSINYTQSTLECYVSCFQIFYSASFPKNPSIVWLKESFDALDSALCCSTSQDRINDVEELSPLQRLILEQVSLVDFDSEGFGLDAKNIFIKLAANWITLAGELRSLEMTRKESIRRPRQSQLPSRTGTPPPSNQRSQVASYVALSVEVLGIFETNFGKWKDDSEFYMKAFPSMILSIGRLMVLKYKAISKINGLQTWIVATSTFNRIFELAPKRHLNSDCWKIIVQILEQSLEASRLMVPLSLGAEELAKDEDFDAGQVKWICSHVLPEMKDLEGAVVKSLLESIEKSSQLYYTKLDSPKLSSMIPEHPLMSLSISDEPIPVVKERFALTCLKSLFEICSRSYSRSLSEPVSGIALKILMDRCRSAMTEYFEESKLQGLLPFPRIRQEEIISILEGLNELRLMPSSCTADSDLASKLISTEVGHLFSLYSELLNLLELNDPKIVKCVRQSFRLMGSVAGVSKS